MVWTQCDETCRPLSSSDADRPAALRSRHREAPELRPQHGRTLHRLDLRRRAHHGGKLPGNHSLIGAIDRWRASGLCPDSIWFRGGSSADTRGTRTTKTAQMCHQVDLYSD